MSKLDVTKKHYSKLKAMSKITNSSFGFRFYAV